MTSLSAVDPASLPRVREHARGVKGWGDLLEVSAVTVLEVAGLLEAEALVAIEAVALV